ncbi:YugN family protein [Cohnella sp. REN36]|uniref:YugN family protein n=1 Tax=Cohnella sp. REN36 TaxID=2887347 RepID=UPI001D159E39|nr:YugN family protein [Cohnella sp. REN36]MCC3377075.1 YugN-like family protein [Cohnella sp. REN36]
MLSLSSSLTSQEGQFTQTRLRLADHGFSLGGNWEYDRGSFDCALDDARQVWLRLPFTVTGGNLDGEAEETDAKIKFGEPYVLKHVYEEGLDQDAQPRTFGGMFDQFAAPSDPDAEIERHWLEDARKRLSEIESIYPA